ncbi:methylcobalamin:coenzyme M methyltransferase [Oxobacter pfennigii]|uniref:Methylcobalamin:coenzyme M methyltransferase n=1 Tax=Oxobacter pfennigii TaxID=36849 RepID=A0A0P8Y8V8_9CLOT|nr:uroporphyrinogen decarboxylase family protein [Oxobacter pfennigii]KPU43188.1 methylcobalamin:coenzyme M methyltransferase [Oxobacter pfennigii]
MKTPQEMYDEHYARLTRAFTWEDQDRPPITYNCDLFATRYMGLKLSELITDTERANTLTLMGTLLMGGGEIDSASPGMYPPASEIQKNMKFPGRDLPDDELWQVNEKEVMTAEDYDTIINKGYGYFKQEFAKRIGDGTATEKIKAMAPVMGRLARNLRSVGIVQLSTAMSDAFVESFCAMRSMPQFFRDLHKIPDKVQAAMDVAIEEHIGELRKVIRANKPLSVFVGGSRSTFLSKKLFERFDLPYRTRIVNAAVEEGAFVHFHLDADWGPKLNYFLDFPKKKCILALDGMTDMFNAKKVLDGHMALMGDVPASLFSLGTPDEVYNYCTRLVNEIGPEGYIMSAGCAAPPNAKADNIKAMVCAVTGK